MVRVSVKIIGKEIPKDSYCVMDCDPSVDLEPQIEGIMKNVKEDLPNIIKNKEFHASPHCVGMIYYETENETLKRIFKITEILDESLKPSDMAKKILEVLL